MRNQTIQNVNEQKVIAILRGLSPEECLKTAQALYHGGIRLLEVTFDQKDVTKHVETIQSIRQIADHFQGKIYIGAGTVTSPALVEAAAKAGAQYIISPDTSQAVIEKTRELELVSMPGALTPTEIMNAHRWGADFVKIFPVGNLGTGYIKAITAPLNHIRFLAVGGVNPDNITGFLDAGCCGAGIGGNLSNRKWIAAGEYERITQTALELTDIIKNRKQPDAR